MENFTPTLLELRKSRGLSQMELSKKLNMSVQRYSRIEKNYKKTTITVLEKILEELGYNITVFFK